MKKFLLLIAATALAGTTYAQSITFKKDWGQILSVQKAPYVKHLMAPHRHNAGSVEKYWGCFFCFIVFCIFAL